MRYTLTAFAAVVTVLSLAACAKKEEAPVTEAPAAEQAPPVDTAPPDATPTEPAPGDENSEDAEQSGGDKVKP